MTTRAWATLVWSMGPAILALGCSGDSTPSRPSLEDTYSGILGKISKELELGHSLAIHPLLGEVRWVPTGTSNRMDEFSLYDTLLVTSFVARHSAEYHLCTLTQLKTCDRDIDPVYVILSEAVELDEAKFGVLSLVFDHRFPAEVQRYYQAYLQPRWGRWHVANFRRVN